MRANPMVEDKDGSTALRAAAEYGFCSMLRYLVRECCANTINAINTVRGKDGMTLLVVAAAKKTADMTKLLLEMGANLHLRDEHGCSVLHIAAGFGCIETIGALLDAGPTIEDSGTTDSDTPLLAAARNGRAETTGLGNKTRLWDSR